MNRILVVDDDAAIRLMLATFLRRRGFQLSEARNGREALAEMRANHPQVVILDLAMPEVSGLDVLRERIANPALQQIPIIVVTANNRRDVAADVRHMNVYAVLAKPFDLIALLATVTSCLDPALAAA